jgi:hypothetical protein
MANTLENRKKIVKARGGLGAAAKRAKRRRLGEVADITMLNFDERKVPLVFRENRRAQRIIMRLDYGAASVVIVLPKRTSRQEGKRFALSNKDWIEERLDQLAEPVPFRHGTSIPFLGEPHRIRHRPNARGVVWCAEGEINVAGYEEHLPRRLETLPGAQPLDQSGPRMAGSSRHRSLSLRTLTSPRLFLFAISPLAKQDRRALLPGGFLLREPHAST